MTWTVVHASDVRPGDILPEVGLVIKVHQRTRQVPRWRVTGADPAIAGGLVPGEEDLVALGVSIEVTGEGGQTAAYAEDSEVRVLREPT